MSRITRSLLVLFLTAGPLLGLPVAPARAHSGGRAQLYVDSLRLEPHTGGWRAALVLRDADSGRPEPGFGVQITASADDGQSAGPTVLTDPDAVGRYAGALPLTAGMWNLTVQAGEIPGGAQAVPFTKTWPVNLRPGQPLDVAGFRTRSADGGAGDERSPVPVIAAVLAAALLAVARTLRRRSPAPASPASRQRQ